MPIREVYFTALEDGPFSSLSSSFNPFEYRGVRPSQKTIHLIKVPTSHQTCFPCEQPFYHRALVLERHLSQRRLILEERARAFQEAQRKEEERRRNAALYSLYSTAAWKIQKAFRKHREEKRRRAAEAIQRESRQFQRRKELSRSPFFSKVQELRSIMHAFLSLRNTHEEAVFRLPVYPKEGSALPSQKRLPNLRFLEYEEGLTKLMIRLDSVSSDGMEEIREARKRLIASIQTLLAALDKLKEQEEKEESFDQKSPQHKQPQDNIPEEEARPGDDVKEIAECIGDDQEQIEIHQDDREDQEDQEDQEDRKDQDDREDREDRRAHDEKNGDEEQRSKEIGEMEKEKEYQGGWEYLHSSLGNKEKNLGGPEEDDWEEVFGVQEGGTD